jgi:hypothetical protein
MIRSITTALRAAGLAAAAIVPLASAGHGCGTSACEGHHGHTNTGGIKPLCLMQPAVPFDTDGMGVITPEEVEAIIAARGEPDMVIRSANRGPGLTLVFNVFGPTNADTVSGLQFTADYYASRIADPIEIVLNVNFDPGSFGGALPTLVDVPYADYVAALRADADADDTVQDLLPDGSSFPARRSLGGAVIQETTLTTSSANLKAVGLPTPGGADSELFIGSLLDGDPSNGLGNGVGGGFFGDFSLVDVLVHEVGHALGFFTWIEFGGQFGSTLDLFRFARDGADNPDTPAEFTLTPRALYFGNSLGQHTFDFVSLEAQASNASNFQASHFEETGAFPFRIGVMEPAIAPFETGFPEYFSEADFAAFDAIGWDVTGDEPPCNDADIAPPFGVLDLGDIQAFIAAFLAQEPAADLVAPFGVFDLGDVQAFAAAFTGGCP